jgi:alpha-1,2-mannosyltransferase
MNRRLIVYPRLVLATVWIIIAINLVFHQGWQGGFGQIIATDFITLYGAGQILRQDADHLYDPKVQEAVQQVLIAPTELGGLNPYISPPYVALAYSAFTFIPLFPSVLLWWALSLGMVFMAGRGISSLIPARLRQGWLNRSYLIVAILSFFPFALGWQAGQNQALTLLLTSGVLLLCLSGRWGVAGLLAGLLIYKPQFALGFLIIWLAWGKFRALGGFALVAGAWVGVSIWLHGLGAYKEYFHLIPVYSLLNYVPGFPGYLMVTPHALLASVLPLEAAPYLMWFDRVILVSFGGGLAWLAFHRRNERRSRYFSVLLLALLFPLVVSPYTLAYDLVILVSLLALWVVLLPGKESPRCFSPGWNAMLVYFGGLVLPVLAFATGIAWLALIPIWLSIALLAQILRRPPLIGARATVTEVLVSPVEHNVGMEDQQ